MLGVTPGSHMGGALLLNRRLYRGPWAAAGDLAHLVVEPGGPPCSSGQCGCPQAVASDGTMVAGARAALEAGLRARLPQWLSARVRVVRAGLGEAAWLTGAASLVLEQVLAPPTGDGVSLLTWEPAGEEG